MARSLSNAKLLVVSFSDALSLSVFRRGYAAAGAQGSLSVKGGSMEIRAAMKEESGASTAWGPDPVTGYYRPQNHAVEIDPVELRNMLLNHKITRTI
ncbi:hypothetical protein LWI29_016127 [Acer saccharum]|uniref:Late embryogenesis abundant protein Lea5 n=1 Tax=Acer saccharum TaxID=4024 RepID=A0AA39TT91_ACESA|nr:hypothetical protein LWI29_016127 [Acer saccharum]KAK1592679.1 hypothetical protein Q3G72_028713 [Acer saccharum]